MARATILIPGPWTSQEDILMALAKRKKYLFAGLILMDIKTKAAFKANLIQNWSAEDYLEEFSPLFPIPSKNKTALPIHSVFIIETESNSFQKMEKLCDAISEVLEIGGYGVKILNSGKVIARKAWEGFSFSPQTFFELFVSVYHTDKGMMTCGMSNFGKKDIFMPLTPDEDGMNFILSYAWYAVNEEPEIKEGETFSLSEDAPIFKIFEEEDNIRDPNHPFYNPFGVWKLLPQEWIDG